jgi:hypothetical protein
MLPFELIFRDSAHDLSLDGYIFADFFKGAMGHCGVAPLDGGMANVYDSKGEVLQFASIDKSFALQHPLRVVGSTYYRDSNASETLFTQHYSWLHHAMESFIIIGPGTHNTHLEWDFRHGIHLMEHPLRSVVQHDFVQQQGFPKAGCLDVSAAGASVRSELTGLRFIPSANGAAAVEFSDKYLWKDSYGAVIETSFAAIPNSGTYSRSAIFCERRR